MSKKSTDKLTDGSGHQPSARQQLGDDELKRSQARERLRHTTAEWLQRVRHTITGLERELHQVERAARRPNDLLAEVLDVEELSRLTGLISEADCRANDLQAGSNCGLGFVDLVSQAQIEGDALLPLAEKVTRAKHTETAADGRGLD